MQTESHRPRFVFATRRLSIVLAACLLCAAAGFGQTTSADKPSVQDKSGTPDKKPADPTTTKLRIEVTGNAKPVGNAAVYVRFNQSGGLLHRDKLAELDLKTNQDGSVKVPAIPRGRIQVQVVADGWHTFGKWYEIETAEQTIQIELKPPAHWY
jgi:hypothetical protein